MGEQGIGILIARDDIRAVNQLAERFGVEAFLVGGGIRDPLLGRESNDMDFALSGAWEDLPRAFASRIGGSFFWLDKERLQGRVVKKGEEETKIYDFAPLAGKGIGDDLAARDFTINAMAVSLSEGLPDLIDPLNGLEDLRLGVIRACSAFSFDNDPLRLMRAIRFSAELGFAVEETTWEGLRLKTPLLKEVTAERVRDELFRTLAAPCCGASLKRLCNSGLWCEINPGQTHETMESGIAGAAEAERLCGETASRSADGAGRMTAYLEGEVEGGITASSLIRLAAFLGRGEGATAPLAERLRLGRSATRMLTFLCRDERRLFASMESTASHRTMFRFFRDREPAGPGMLIVSKAGGEISEGVFSGLLGYFLREYDLGKSDLFLSGGEVMEILAIPPGKTVGEALERLREAEASGVVSDRDDARAFVKNLLTKEEPIG